MLRNGSVLHRWKLTGIPRKLIVGRWFISFEHVVLEHGGHVHFLESDFFMDTTSNKVNNPVSWWWFRSGESSRYVPQVHKPPTWEVWNWMKVFALPPRSLKLTVRTWNTGVGRWVSIWVPASGQNVQKKTSGFLQSLFSKDAVLESEFRDPFCGP